MTTQVKGLTYTRLPRAGETVTVKGEDGAFIAVKVYAGDELIAYDQAQTSDNLHRSKLQRLKRVGLASRAMRHWRSKGHVVVDQVVILP